MGFLSLEERTKSSGERELLAILYAVQSFAPLLRGHRVRILSDSTNAVAVVDHGSRKAHLQALAVRIFWFCQENDIHLTVDWIPRALNCEADHVSKWHDGNDWQLNPKWFAILDRRFGPHTVDRFATHVNTLLPRFNSFFSCPGTEATDCFTQIWTLENNWCNPPFCIIGRLLRFIQSQRAKATVVIPLWKSAVWWPTLCPSGEFFAPWVVSVVPLPRSADLFFPGKASGNAFGVGPPRWNVLALRVDCSDLHSGPCVPVPILHY